MDLEEASIRISGLSQEKSIVISDPNKKDNPIVYVNDAFTYLTGYHRSEILGRNCRFLQGAETSLEKLETMRKAIEEKAELWIDIENYKKDGQLFMNHLHIKPYFNENGDIDCFIGVQHEI